MRRTLHYIYLANLLLGFHYSLVLYINSSFLLQFTNKSTLDVIYIISAGLNILALLLLPRFLHSINTKPLATGIILTEFLAMIGLGLSQTASQAILFFIIIQAMGSLILFCLDLFLEASIKNENHTGRSRAFFLTSTNVAILISFGISGMIASRGSFSPIYLLSAMILVPLLFITLFKLKEGVRRNVGIKIQDIVRFLKNDGDVARVLFANLVLQFFYATMVIHLPLLLHKEMGFSWGQIGAILVVMVLPFVLFEIPVGKLIDRKTGASEFLFLGFIIMSVSCLTLSLLGGGSILIWTSILFMSRIGAALVEISCESYFFKKVTERNASIISLFRITQPLALMLAPAVASLILLFTGLSGLFSALGFIVLLGITFIPKTDTK